VNNLLSTATSQHVASSDGWGNFGLPVAAGIIVAIFSVWLSEYRQARRNSRLRFQPVEFHTQTAELALPVGTMQTVDQYVWRLPVINLASRPAHDVTTQLQEIVDLDALRPEVVAAPLNWMHNPAGIYTRDIFRSQVAYLDIFQWTRQMQPRPVLCNSPVMGIPQSNSLPVDEVRLKIELYQVSGQRIDVYLILHLIPEDFAHSSLRIWRVVREHRFLMKTWFRETRSIVASSRFKGVAGTW
jgi:hypothetical protein